MGKGVSPEEFNLIKFHLGEFALVAATLRPETIYGATNVWVNPDAEYSEARVDGELWVVSSSALTRLAEQKHDVVPVRSFKGSDLLGRYAMAPLTGKSLPMLPGRFVDDSLATGVVYSVPAHAPYDLMALRDIQEGRVQVGRQIKEIADKHRPASRYWPSRDIPRSPLTTPSRSTRSRTRWTHDWKTRPPRSTARSSTRGS